MGCQNGGSDWFEAIMTYYDRLFSAMKTIWINKVRKRQDNKAITPSPVKSPQ